MSHRNPRPEWKRIHLASVEAYRLVSGVFRATVAPMKEVMGKRFVYSVIQYPAGEFSQSTGFARTLEDAKEVAEQIIADHHHELGDALTGRRRFRRR